MKLVKDQINFKIFSVILIGFLMATSCNSVLFNNKGPKSKYYWHDVLSNRCNCDEPLVVYKDVYEVGCENGQDFMDFIILRWECYKQGCFIYRINYERIRRYDLSYGMTPVTIALYDFSSRDSFYLVGVDGYMLLNSTGFFVLRVPLPGTVVMIKFLGREDSVISAKEHILNLDKIYEIVSNKDTFYLGFTKDRHVWDVAFWASFIRV